jgi:hypothetical protein
VAFVCAHVQSHMRVIYTVMNNLEGACTMRLQKRAAALAARVSARAAQHARQIAANAADDVKKRARMAKSVGDLHARYGATVPTSMQITRFVNTVVSETTVCAMERLKYQLGRCKSDAQRCRFLHGFVLERHIKGRRYLHLLRHCEIRFYIRDLTTFPDLLVDGVHDPEEWFDYWQRLSGDTKKTARILLESGKYDEALQYARACNDNYIQPAVIKTMDSVVEQVVALFGVEREIEIENGVSACESPLRMPAAIAQRGSPSTFANTSPSTFASFACTSPSTFAGTSPRRFAGTSPITFAGTSPITFPGTSPITFAGTSPITFAGTSPITFADSSPILSIDALISAPPADCGINDMPFSEFMQILGV